MNGSTGPSLTEEDLWSVAGPEVVEATRFEGLPSFYPVYAWGDLYACSPWPLLRRKGQLNLDEDVARCLLRPPPGDVAPPNPLLDVDIRRIGGPPKLVPRIADRERFASAMAEAMIVDLRSVEMRNAGRTHAVLCGGKDSLNLLLLPWAVAPIALSAEPNLPLVREFIERNGLNADVRPLVDVHDPDQEALEIAEGFCQVDMRNWKWSVDLKRFADEREGSIVFWKGQMADAFFTDYWRSYTSSTLSTYRYLRKAYQRAARILPSLVDGVYAEFALEDFRRSLWLRGGTLQGAHMGFLRSITGCLFVSGYHGRETSRTLYSADLRQLFRGAPVDLRPAIGRALLGREVWYPPTNPSPPTSSFRRGYRDLSRFVDTVESFGVDVVDAKFYLLRAQL